MNSFKNGRVRESGKPPIPGYAIATSCLSFFQSAETRENTTFVLILVPFGLEGYLAGFYTYPVAIPAPGESSLGGIPKFSKTEEEISLSRRAAVKPIANSCDGVCERGWRSDSS